MAKPGRPKGKTSFWVTTPEILRELNISRSHLYKLRLESFRKGYHYRDVRPRTSVKACYRWHIKRINDLLDQCEN